MSGVIALARLLCETSPIVSDHARAWVVPALLILLGLLFISAAVIGPIARSEQADDVDREQET